MYHDVMNPQGSKTKVGQDKSEIVRELPAACGDERVACEFLERQRWGDDPCCPCCGSVAVYKMTKRGTDERQKNLRWRCRDCGKQFTVRTGTVMEDSRIPLHHWCYAFWRAATSKKGVSALEIKRHTGLSYKSALFLMHRIRWAMAPTEDGPKLTGTVEADETFIGGKPRYKSKHSKDARKPGQKNPAKWREEKAVVFAAVQRDGQARARVVPDVKATTLRAAIAQHIDDAARLMTDEARAYIPIGKERSGSHEVVPHKNRIYARGDVTTNTVEGFFSLIKRGIYGVYHNVSREHLQRYIDEFEFRYNHRHMEDGERTVAAIRGGEGKRLMYREPAGQA